jgi:hypothetical protein
MNATLEEKEKFLVGHCVSFASAVKEIDPDCEGISIFYADALIHCAVISNGKIVDVTGRWDTEEEYFTNLKKEYERIEGEQYNEMWWIEYKDEWSALCCSNTEEIKEAIDILKRGN